MYKYHFVSKCFDTDSIMDDMDRKFFKVLFSPVHFLHSLLPPVKSNPYELRSRDHNFQLPACNNFRRKSFINQCPISHVADVANATGLRPQGASGSREKIFSPSVVK